MKWIHFIYAHLFGYFWLPCPKCGRMFGGHQAKASIWEGDIIEPGMGQMTCCLKEQEFKPNGWSANSPPHSQP